MAINPIEPTTPPTTIGVVTDLDWEETPAATDDSTGSVEVTNMEGDEIVGDGG